MKQQSDKLYRRAVRRVMFVVAAERRRSIYPLINRNVLVLMPQTYLAKIKKLCERAFETQRLRRSNL